MVVDLVQARKAHQVAEGGTPEAVGGILEEMLGRFVEFASCEFQTWNMVGVALLRCPLQTHYRLPNALCPRWLQEDGLVEKINIIGKD